jgi:hypothetical protein
VGQPPSLRLTQLLAFKGHRSPILHYDTYRNPSFGLATKAKGIARVRAKEDARELSQQEARESHHILPGVLESVSE